ncbi:MAG: FMN-binding protein [Clostridia bacterium]|nr:FMN-binding protein [Clostridia bacterium]
MENERIASLKPLAIITGKLMLITVLSAVLLACINLITEPIIAANESSKKNAAVLQLFPDATDIYQMNEASADAYPDGISEVFSVYKAGTFVGCCIVSEAMGFGDNISTMVGVGADSRVIGIRVLSIAETPGIGMAAAEQTYLDSYIGLAFPVTFEDGANHADAITGATYSSRAIRDAVNLALEYSTQITPQTSDTETEGSVNE